MQHANEDVEKMILGNKSDMEEKRVVSSEKGEAVSVSNCNCDYNYNYIVHNKHVF
jgi:hypothetical protein